MLRRFGTAAIALAATVTAIAISSPSEAAVVVSTAPTANMNCTDGLCVNSAANAVLNVDQLRDMLRDGNVTVQAGTSAQDIAFQAPLRWSASTLLTLDANRSLTIAAPVSAIGTGNVTFVTRTGGYAFGGAGKLNFWDDASTFVVNGQVYALKSDLASLAGAIAANPSGRYALALRYDASVDGAYAAPPIQTVFTGTLEGLGHSVAGLTVDLPKGAGASGAGLFSHIGTGGTVQNLVLDHPTLRSRAYGALAGAIAAKNEGTILFASVIKPSVSGEGRSSAYGGAVGENNGGLFQVSVRGGHVTGHHQDESGGLAGFNLGFISICASSAAVTSDLAAGGLVGFNYQRIVESRADGLVTVGDAADDDAFAGGLVAWNDAEIRTSFATGAVRGGTGANGHHVMAGGLVGNHFGDMIDNDYARGGVRAGANSYVGGLAGENNGDIQSAYSIGAASGGMDASAGGLVGEELSPDDPVLTYWDTTASGLSQGAGNVSNQPGITGLTTAQFKSGLPAGLNTALWREGGSTNTGYPYLIANPPR